MQLYRCFLSLLGNNPSPWVHMMSIIRGLTCYSRQWHVNPRNDIAQLNYRATGVTG